MKTEVMKFMGAVGGLVDYNKEPKEKLFERILARKPFSDEEYREFYEDGALAQNGQLTIDGLVDRLYFSTQDWIDLELAGFDVMGAIQAIHANNALKYTTNVTTVRGWLEELQENTGLDKWYICSSVYQGTTYHCLKDKVTNKVCKYWDFPTVDLSPFVPERYK